jgi:hypothetical protein
MSGNFMKLRNNMTLNFRDITAVMFLCSVMTIPRSYIVIKLAFLAVFILTHLLIAIARWRSFICRRVVAFYLLVAFAGMAWAIVGIANGGVDKGIEDGLRLYVLWSVAYAVIVPLIMLDKGLTRFHCAIVLSGILIAITNLLGLVDHVYQLHLIPYDVKKELDLFVGIHNGYVQITSHNIGSLFFIVTYLLAIQFRRDAAELNTALTKTSLIMCVIISALSGRRALWLCLTLAPFLVFAVAAASNTLKSLSPRLTGLVSFFATLSLFLLIWIMSFGGDTLTIGFVDHLSAAFSVDDERTIQKSYLVRAFYDHPFLGSGFGVGAGYVRNEERPWLYELTYYQLLYNFGVIGILYFLTISKIYFGIALSIVARRGADAPYAFCLLVGLLSFMVAAYSNPYFGSFDFLLFLAVLPLLASMPKPRQRSVDGGSRTTIGFCGAARK